MIIEFLDRIYRDIVSHEFTLPAPFGKLRAGSERSRTGIYTNL